jgi:hypothetical protein
LAWDAGEGVGVEAGEEAAALHGGIGPAWQPRAQEES